MKTHIGLSFANFMSMMMVSVIMFVNYVTTDYDSTFTCCSLPGVTLYGCTASLLAFGQVVTGIICSLVIMFLFYKYYDHTAADADARSRGV